MTEKPLFFKMLAGTIRTVGQDDDGAEQVQMVHVSLGNPLPAGVPADELERLQRIGAVGGKAAVTVIADEPAPAAAKKPRASKKAPAAAKKAATDLAGLAELDDAGLVKVLVDEKPGVKKLLAAVGTDKELAQRLLVAEKQTGSEPRGTLVAGLEKVIAGGAS